MAKEKINHPKGWKRKYKFSRQGEVAAMKEARITHLQSREHRGCMAEIAQWNSQMQGLA
jgi:hypothetical protein